MSNRGLSLCAIAATLIIAACGGGQQQTQMTTTTTTVAMATPPPPVATPVPVIKAHAVPGAGRADPFAPLYGPPSAPSVAAPAPSAPRVSVSGFPNIPTLPGFEGAPKAAGPRSIWDTVRVTGIVHDGVYSAIVETNGQSYIVHAGSSVGGTFRVVAIGNNYVTLATSKEERSISLGG